MKENSKRRREGAPEATDVTPALGRRFKVAAAALASCALLAASFAATRNEAVRRAVGLRPLLVAAREQGSLPLSKEYVYVGGRLIATEVPAPAPAPTPAGPPPSNLVASATNASNVSLTWAAPSAGVVVGYVVERRDGLDAQPELIPTGSSATAFNDSRPPGDFAYLYRVKAVFAGGYSDFSNYDLATTVAFTNEPLVPNVTPIKAAHLTELRRAVRAVRTLAAKGAPAWNYPDPVSSPGQRRAIYLEDVTDLRTQLDEALLRLDQALGVQSFLKPYPASPALARNAPVRAAHFEQIRERVK